MKTIFVVLSAIAGIVLVTCNTHYICYVLDLYHNYQPSASTQQIHSLYSRAIENRIGVMKKDVLPDLGSTTLHGHYVCMLCHVMQCRVM